MNEQKTKSDILIRQVDHKVIKKFREKAVNEGFTQARLLKELLSTGK